MTLDGGLFADWSGAPPGPNSTRICRMWPNLMKLAPGVTYVSNATSEQITAGTAHARYAFSDSGSARIWVHHTGKVEAMCRPDVCSVQRPYVQTPLNLSPASTCLCGPRTQQEGCVSWQGPWALLRHSSTSRHGHERSTGTRDRMIDERREICQKEVFNWFSCFSHMRRPWYKTTQEVE